MLKFLVFADMHYKKGMYAVQVAHLQAILDRAASENVDFVIHLGDFCNDYKGSPELTKAYLNNNHNLPVYGIYGNHELESKGNTMELVTPLLCNREVVFAEADTGYWHADLNGYRLIGLDTNYSFCEATQQWQHNREASWGAPSGNSKAHSLSPRQLDWLNMVLEDAAAAKRKTLVFSHAALSDLWYSSPDAHKVRDLFRKYAGTVIMSLNGHLHTDHFAILDNIAYFDVNAAHNGCWIVCNDYHYDENHTFSFSDYDAEGNLIHTKNLSLNTLSQGKNTWFFTDPLSAIVTIGDDGDITIEGSQTNWLHGVAPSVPPETGIVPFISNNQLNTTVKI